MVKTQEYTDKIYYLWNNEFDFVKRGDGEYWLPKYRWFDKGLSNIKICNLQDLCINPITKGETPIWRGDAYVKQGVPFIRSEQLKSFFLDLSLNPVYIPIKTHSRMARSKILNGDILLAIVGATTGQCALVNDIDEANCNQAVAIIRPKKIINCNYLITVINSDTVQSQIQRIGSGGARVNIDLNEVRELKIPVLKEGFQGCIDKLVNNAFNLRQQADQEHKQAQEILEKELGLDKSNFKDQTVFWQWSDDIDIVKKLNPNYYQPKYFILKKKGYVTAKLSKIADVITSNFNDSQLLDSKYKYIEIGDININNGEISDSTFDYISKLPKNPKRLIKENDILYSKVRPYRKGIGFVTGDFNNCLATSGFSVIRLKEESNLTPEYLFLFLRSDAGLLNSIRNMTGATYPTINDAVVSDIEIPILISSIQQKISFLIKSSFEKRKQSRESLEKAKKIVEDLIEGKTK